MCFKASALFVKAGSLICRIDPTNYFLSSFNRSFNCGFNVVNVNYIFFPCK